MNFRSIFIFLSLTVFLASCSSTNTKSVHKFADREFCGSSTDRR